MSNHTAKRPSKPLSAPVLVVDDFLSAELASCMRTDIEKHIAEPQNHQAQTHQIWNYWFVPGLYTYLRTRPEKIIHQDNVGTFVNALRDWSIGTLGLSKVSWPFLSLYVSGCRQGLHNDSRNGRFAFVYSLTKAERQTVGGGTIIFREGDILRRSLDVANAGVDFYELVEPKFNRLVVFDDRLMHGVERVDGTMDPAHGRWVLHGHIEEGGPIVTGQLPIEAIREGICIAVDHFVADCMAAIQLYHGPLVCRFKILPEGGVSDVEILLDRVIQQDNGNVDWEPLRSKLLERLGHAVFPASKGETTVALPVTFGARLLSD